MSFLLPKTQAPVASATGAPPSRVDPDVDAAAAEQRRKLGLAGRMSTLFSGSSLGTGDQGGSAVATLLGSIGKT